MKYVYVLEKELKFRKEIHEALVKIDPRLEVRYFIDLESFSNWINLIQTDGNKALAIGGLSFVELNEPVKCSDDDHLALIVCSDEIIGSRSVELLKKMHHTFIEKGICSKESPTSIVITAFDDPNFKIEKLEIHSVNNVIYKPFDLMILLQHLNNAICGRTPPDENFLHTMKVSANLEMLKDIKMETISQIGITTISDRAIEVGVVSKYYGKDFTSGKTRSVMAKCVRCEPHPTIKDQFLITLNFFALEVGQIRDLRKLLTGMKADSLAAHEWNNSAVRVSAKGINIVVLDEKKQTIGDTISRNLVGSNLVEYNSWESFHEDFDPSKNPILSQKSLPVESGFTVITDIQGHFILQCEPEIKDESKLFGLNFEQLKKIDLAASVSLESKTEWANIFRLIESGPVPGNRVINFNVQNQKFFVKFISKEKIKLPDGKIQLKLGFNELTYEEKLNHLKSLSKWPKNIDLALVTESFYQKLTEAGCKLPGKHFLISNDILSDNEEKKYAPNFHDIFVPPFDRNYLAVKIKSHMGLLLPEDAQTYNRNSLVQVANPVDLVEISESGVILKYSRAISIGSFRKFILWTPRETELLEYTASCNYTEAVEGEDPHVLNHFIFFGMRDIYLKNVRLWIRENYISAKEKTG